MNFSDIRKSPLFAAAGAGFLGFAFRALLYRVGFDDKGILSDTHLLHLLCVALTGAIGTYLTVCPIRARSSSPAHSHICFLPALLGGYFMLIHSLTLFSRSTGLLELLRFGLAVLSALAMVISLLPILKNRQIRPVCLGLICIGFALDMLCRYRAWSGNPQLPDYLFHLLAGVSLSLGTYHTLAFHTGLGKVRVQRFCCPMALFLCLLSLAGPDTWEFYLSGAFWAIACALTPAPPEKEIPTMFLPESILYCIDTLEQAGFQAWVVGGCVRDALLGLTPNDYDLCTDALPEQTEAVFAAHPLILNGKKHGTVAVILDSNVVEITTFRTEGDYRDNRHPEWVEFVPDIEKDLARRDFTVNAMAYSPARGFADPFGGREDLKNQVLRAVGDPAARFREDSLRILRGARFSVKYRLEPDPATEEAMVQLAPLMENLARERVWSELCKLIVQATSEDLLRFAPVITQVIPELKPQLGYDQNNHHHIYDLYTHTAQVVAAQPAQLHLRWSALLHDVGKPHTRTEDEKGEAHYHGHAALSAEMAGAILLRLKSPTALREQVETLIDKHMVWFPEEKKVIRRWISRLGFDMVRDLISFQEADCLATGTSGEKEKAHFALLHQLMEEVQTENSCLTLKDLAVNGHDLMVLGIQGKAIGETLNRLLNLVMEDAIPNEKAALLAAVREEIQ